MPLATQLADRRWRRLLAAQIEEALAVLKAAGITPARIEGVPPRPIPRILRLPDWLFRRVARRMLAIDPQARSSMWEDLERRRPTEIDYLQGAILALAAKRGVRGAAHRAHRCDSSSRPRQRGAGSPGLTPEQVASVRMRRMKRRDAGRETMDADVIVVGGGLAGLVATAELVDAGKQGDPARPGAASSRWAARRSGRSAACSSSTRPSSGACASATSHDLALQDWMGSAGFDRDGGPLAAQVGRGLRRLRRRREARLAARAGACAGFPIVGWAERGGYIATGHGNSVPRFHVTWGTGPGVIAPFVRACARARRQGLVSLRFRHRVNG